MLNQHQVRISRRRVIQQGSSCLSLFQPTFFGTRHASPANNNSANQASITMSPATTSKNNTSSSADGFRHRSRLVSDLPRVSSSECSVVALARLLPERSSASFLEDSSPVAKRARVCFYLQEALDLCDMSLALLNDDDDDDDDDASSETNTHSSV
jgi:hypothetical protein